MRRGWGECAGGGEGKMRLSYGPWHQLPSLPVDGLLTIGRDWQKI